jgi:hypothetical protein
MMNFKEYINNINSGNNKLWKAKKADVMEHWKELEPVKMITMQPVDSDHKGSKFRSDGVRITGSPAFINSVLSRIKDLSYLEETTGNRLDVEYRQIAQNDTNESLNPSYVFYCHLIKSK